MTSITVARLVLRMEAIKAMATDGEVQTYEMGHWRRYNPETDG